MAEKPSDPADPDCNAYWREFCDQHGLDGRHKYWHEDAQRDLAREREPKPPMWHVTPAADAFEGTRELDAVGRGVTVEGAVGYFNCLMEAYIPRWLSSGADLEVFAEGTETRRLHVLRAVADLWAGVSALVDRCHERVYVPAVKTELAPLVNNFKLEAQELARKEAERRAALTVLSYLPPDEARPWEPTPSSPPSSSQLPVNAAAGAAAPKKPRKPQRAVMIDQNVLMTALKQLNTKKGNSLSLDDPHELANQLAAMSPPGSPNARTWLKVLLHEQVREDVVDRLVIFFKPFAIPADKEKLIAKYVND